MSSKSLSFEEILSRGVCTYNLIKTNQYISVLDALNDFETIIYNKSSIENKILIASAYYYKGLIYFYHYHAIPTIETNLSKLNNYIALYSFIQSIKYNDIHSKNCILYILCIFSVWEDFLDKDNFDKYLSIALKNNHFLGDVYYFAFSFYGRISDFSLSLKFYKKFKNFPTDLNLMSGDEYLSNSEINLGLFFKINPTSSKDSDSRTVLGYLYEQNKDYEKTIEILKEKYDKDHKLLDALQISYLSRKSKVFKDVFKFSSSVIQKYNFCYEALVDFDLCLINSYENENNNSYKSLISDNIVRLRSDILLILSEHVDMLIYFGQSNFCLSDSAMDIRDEAMNYFTKMQIQYLTATIKFISCIPSASLDQQNYYQSYLDHCLHNYYIVTDLQCKKILAKYKEKEDRNLDQMVSIAQKYLSIVNQNNPHREYFEKIILKANTIKDINDRNSNYAQIISDIKYFMIKTFIPNKWRSFILGVIVSIVASYSKEFLDLIIKFFH